VKRQLESRPPPLLFYPPSSGELVERHDSISMNRVVERTKSELARGTEGGACSELTGSFKESGEKGRGELSHGSGEIPLSDIMNQNQSLGLASLASIRR
jgi:hypothetical protein